MLHPGKLGLILAALSPRLGFPAPEITEDIANAHEPRSWPYDDAREDGIEVIPISGSLVNRYATGPSGTLSYDRIRDRVRQAANNPEIRGILLRVDSFGGEVSGSFDAADELFNAKQKKPVWASVDDNAYSAAYLLASQADRIYTTRTGGVGSVGVIAVHYDFSRLLNNEGITPTLVYAGARKPDFYPETPLPPEARNWLQAEVNRDYDEFVGYVAMGRPLTEEAVRATEAGLFSGERAVAAGFADRLGTFEQALTEFQAELNGGSQVRFSVSPTQFPIKEESMSQTIPVEPKAAEPTAAPIVAEHPVVPQGAVDDRKTERERIRAILGCEEAQGREALAQTIALETNTDPEAARKLLAAAQPESKNSFAEAMARVKNPEVGADADNPESEAAEVKRILALSGQLKEV